MRKRMLQATWVRDHSSSVQREPQPVFTWRLMHLWLWVTYLLRDQYVKYLSLFLNKESGGCVETQDLNSFERPNSYYGMRYEYGYLTWNGGKSYLLRDSGGNERAGSLFTMRSTISTSLHWVSPLELCFHITTLRNLDSLWPTEWVCGGVSRRDAEALSPSFYVCFAISLFSLQGQSSRERWLHHPSGGSTRNGGRANQQRRLIREKRLLV